METPPKHRLSLAQARKRRAMTATTLAEKAKVAVSTITRIETYAEKGEKPKRPIRFDTIDAIAKALDMSRDEIDWPGDPLGLEGE